MKLSVNPINYVNPVCCVATVCQVRCMYWGHLGHFHRVIFHSKWYKIVCVRYLACKFSQMKSISMFSMFLQSGVPRHFLRIESTKTTSMEDVSGSFHSIVGHFLCPSKRVRQTCSSNVTFTISYFWYLIRWFAEWQAYLYERKWADLYV